MLSGDEIDGHKIVRPNIAEGGSSIICEAIDSEGRRCALKILREDTVSEFKNEYKNLIGIRHPNVAKAYNFGFYNGHFYFSSEFIEGEPLVNFVRGKKPDDVVPLFIQVLEGLDFIHRNGLLHLDIKSENVLVTQKNGKPVVKIIDLGIATDPKKYKGLFLGSPSYVSPEVALGLVDKVNARADLFSFGVLMYLCLTWGQHPFKRFMAKGDIKKVREVIEKEKEPMRTPAEYKTIEVPEFLSTITMRLLAKKPEERFYSNARAVINALTTHDLDSFSNAETSYLLPPENIFIGQEDFFKQIGEAVCSNRSGVFSCIGGHGLGKTRLLACVKLRFETEAKDWFVGELPLPTTYDEATKWTSTIQFGLSKNERGALVLVDNFHELNSLDKQTQDLVGAVLKNLCASICERRKNPNLYQDIKPVVLLFTSAKDTYAKLPIFGEAGAAHGSFDGRVELKPFTKTELREYLSMTPAFSHGELDNSWVSGLYAKTKGIPLEVGEYLSGLDKRGVLFGLDGELIAQKKLPEMRRVPKSTEKRLLTEYGSLNAFEKELVGFVSVWQHRGIARPVTRKDIGNFFYSASVFQTLENLREKGIFVVSCHSLEFANRYLASLVYGRIEPADRELMHDQIAAYLKSDPDARLLHRGYGSDKASAVRSLIILGKRLLYKQGRVEIAREIFADTLALVDTKTTSTCRIKNQQCLIGYTTSLYLNALYFCGRYGEIEAAAKKIAEPKTKVNKYWWLRQRISYVQMLIRRKKFEEAKKEISGAAKLARGLGFAALGVSFDNYYARCFYEEAFTSATGSEALLLKSLEIYKATLKECTLKNLTTIGPVLSNDVGMVLKALAKNSDAIKELGAKIKQLQKNNYVFGVIEILLAISEAERGNHDYEKAEKYALQALELAKTVEAVKWLVSGNQVLINVYHDSDRFSDALSVAKKCLSVLAALSEETEYSEATRTLWIKMGHCYKELKNYQKAISYFEGVVKQPRKDIYTMSAYVGLSEALYFRKDIKRARNNLQMAGELIKKFPEKTHLRKITELQTIFGARHPHLL